MGYPNTYYKKALQYFAYTLVSLENSELAGELINEESEKKLEQFILEKKKTYNTSQFYYDAGRTCQQLLTESEKEGCDAFNACLGGLNRFDDLIELNKETNNAE